MIYNKEKKYLEPALSGAANYLAHINETLKLPANVIMCPVSALNKIVENNFPSKRYKVDGADVFVLEKHNCAYVTNFGQGAPAFAMSMEVLIALGAKNILLAGYAGSLQKTLAVGGIVLCNGALRDEGVSANYQPPADFAYPSQSLTDKVEETLKAKDIPYTLGPAWTTDALFRETAKEIMHYQSKGIAVVEMEAAAAFAIAKHHKVKCSAIFAVSDQLANLKWEPHFGAKEITEGMKKILEVMLEVFKAN